MYNYETEKAWIFTDEGSRQFLRIRDHVHKLLDEAGAVSMEKARARESGDNWKSMACVDRMVELKEIREVPREDYPAQHRIFTKMGE